MELTDSDRADIARIVINSNAGIHETLAKHFIAVGLEPAVRCEQFADVTRPSTDASVPRRLKSPRPRFAHSNRTRLASV